MYSVIINLNLSMATSLQLLNLLDKLTKRLNNGKLKFADIFYTDFKKYLIKYHIKDCCLY